MSETKNLAAALVQAQAEIEPILEDSDNPFYKSKYMSLSQLRETVRGTLGKHGLAVVQMPVTENDRIGLRTVIVHSSGESLDCGTLTGTVDAKDPHKIGSCLTYFRRYAIASVLGCVADLDDDANHASGRGPRPQRWQQNGPIPTTGTKADETLIAATKVSFANCKTTDELKALGNLIKTDEQYSDYSRAKCRVLYDERLTELKGD